MDIKSLAEDLGLEEEDVHRLILTFLETTEQDLLLLNQAYSQKDAERLRATAHHIKGAARNLELNEIAEAAMAIEEKAGSGIVEDPAVAIQSIRKRLELIRSELSVQD
jgi:HPt (histidine-containing phosphotransfer) domain-containing protein